MYSSLDPRLTMDLAQAESEKIFTMPGYGIDSELTMELYQTYCTGTELFPSTSIERLRI
jgi:hypothetical protein